MKTSYDWFVKRHRTRGLELAHDQVTSAFDTVAWLQKATQSFSAKNLQQTKQYIENLYKTEEGVDQLRLEVFMNYPKEPLFYLITERIFCTLLNVQIR